MNQTTLNNLIAFLNRIDLKGSEVGAFNEVLQAIKQDQESLKEKVSGNSKKD